MAQVPIEHLPLLADTKEVTYPPPISASIRSGVVMTDNSSDGWHNLYLRARQIESEVGLQTGSVKPEVNGQYSLILLHLSDEQIRQLAHVWYVLSRVQISGDAHHKPANKKETPPTTGLTASAASASVNRLDPYPAGKPRTRSAALYAPANSRG